MASRVCSPGLHPRVRHLLQVKESDSAPEVPAEGRKGVLTNAVIAMNLKREVSQCSMRAS